MCLEVGIQYVCLIIIRGEMQIIHTQYCCFMVS